MPAGPIYVAVDLDRGDHIANWSPDEALPAILAAGRTPLTLGEGIHWLLQQPEVLERRHCFMTIGSRLRKTDGSLDARTAALWISNGTGRDGPENRNAPKVGWCWAGPAHLAGLRLSSQPDPAVSDPRMAVGTGSPKPGLSRQTLMVTGGQNCQLRATTNAEKPRSLSDQNGGSTCVLADLLCHLA